MFLNVEEINDVVIDSLNKSLRPYLIKTKFDIKNIQKLYECPPFCNFFYQDDVINYSLLTNGKNENNQFDVEFTSNDTNKDIKDNLNINKIIKLPDGEILSRIIIGNYLKLKKDLTEEEEIKIAKEYQVLSKNTSLFGEIIGEGGQNELIKVELAKNDQSDRRFNILNNKINYNMNLNSFGSKNSSSSYNKFFMEREPNMNILNMFREMKMRSLKCDVVGAAPKMAEMSKKMKKKSLKGDAAPDYELEKNFLNNFLENEKIKIENKNQFNDLQKIIMSQDIIEGYWEENENTKNIENKFKEIFNKISNFIESNEKIKDKSKVKYTFIILYYLINDEKEKLNENKLIINKGKKYLISNNTSYDEIFSKI